MAPGWPLAATCSGALLTKLLCREQKRCSVAPSVCFQHDLREGQHAFAAEGTMSQDRIYTLAKHCLLCKSRRSPF